MDVILAHESRAVRGFLRSGLGPTPYAAAHPQEAGSAPELLRTLEAVGDAGALLLLDWNLPGLDVPLLLSHLAGNGVLDRVSILLCVNGAQVPLAEQAVRRGARGYLVRPFTDEELAVKIARLPATRTGEDASDVLRNIVTTARVQEALPSIFSLPSAFLSQLLAGSVRARYQPGAVLLSPGEILEGLPFVTSGDVEIETTERPAGRRVRGVGECFGEQEFVCGEPARIRVRARSAVEVASVPRESVVDLARRHPALQDFLAQLLVRRPSLRTEEAQAELAGTTASLPFADLLQYLHSARKTGLLLLDSDSGCGRIALDRGEVCDARMEGEEAGEAAFAVLAARPAARFEFRPGPAPALRTVTRSTMQLLMGCFLPSSESVA